MEKKESIAILAELANRIDILLEKDYEHPDFSKWRKDVDLAIRYIFGNDSQNIYGFDRITYSLGGIILVRGSAWQRAYTSGLERARAFIQSLIEEIETYWTDSNGDNLSHSPQPIESTDTAKVFVIHGRDLILRNHIFEFLRSISLTPIEWSQAISLTGKGTPSIGEILDSAFNHAQALLVLITGDDEVKLTAQFYQKDEPAYEKETNYQPRPNVLFEAGMSIGRYPDRTVMVQIGQLKHWSDIAGKHITYLDNSAEKRNELVTKLKNAGCQVDTSGDSWYKSGNFE